MSRRMSVAPASSQPIDQIGVNAARPRPDPDAGKRVGVNVDEDDVVSDRPGDSEALISQQVLQRD